MKEEIFVCIASYRDKQLQKTVASLVENAEHPEQIEIGILNQIDFDHDQACMIDDLEKYPQVWQHCMNYRASKGCCWARSYVYQHLFNDQKFVLQLDSHCRVLKNWDTELKTMWKALHDPKGILTHYAMDFGDDEILKDEYFIKFKCSEFLKKYEIPNLSSITSRKRPKKPVKMAFVAGGFLFGLGKIFREVPYDPYLYFLGEEQTYSARLWTHGYNFYAPQKSIVWHYYSNKTLNRRRHWEDNTDWEDLEKLSIIRYKHLLGREKSNNEQALKDINCYGLGKERSLEEYERFSGISFKEQTVQEFAKKGEVNEAYAISIVKDQ